jgi:hypothetical protein
MVCEMNGFMLQMKATSYLKAMLCVITLKYSFICGHHCAASVPVLLDCNVAGWQACGSLHVCACGTSTKYTHSGCVFKLLGGPAYYLHNIIATWYGCTFNVHKYYDLSML